MLRMLEIPLSKAKTAEEAAKMLIERFTRHFKAEQTDRQMGPSQAPKWKSARTFDSVVAELIMGIRSSDIALDTPRMGTEASLFH